MLHASDLQKITPDYAVALTQIAQLEIKLGNYEKAEKTLTML
jgi:hypothetical protein